MTAPRFLLSHPQLAPTLNRLPTAALMCAAGLLVGVALAWAQTPTPTSLRQDRTEPGRPADESARPQAQSPAGSNKSSSNKSPRPKAKQRLREGTEIIDQPGHFRMTGDRVAFFTADGKGRFVGLENLNLERIARTVADNPDRLQWAVTGTITEYRGANFLFVRRAILKSRVRSRQSGF